MRLPKDQIELQALEDAADSDGYRLIVARNRAAIAACEKKLRTCTAEDLPKLQGEIAGLELALSLPKIIHDEIRLRLRKTDPQ